MDKHMEKQRKRCALGDGAADMSKWIRIRTMLLTATAIMFVISATIGSAWAYFTTYARARGSVQIHLGHQEHLTEEFDFTAYEKTINITSESDSRPVYLRVQAFCADQKRISYRNASNWTQVGDWMYYNGVLGPGESLPEGDQLKVRIEKIPQDGSVVLKSGDGYNVIVVYESTEVQYEDGTQLKAQDADWNRSVDTNRTSTTVGGGN